MEVCVIGWVASRACYIGVIGLSEGGPATRDLPGTNRVLESCEQDAPYFPRSDPKLTIYLFWHQFGSG